MIGVGKPSGDSVEVSGGCVPGLPDTPAFTLRGIEPSPIPVVLAVPHAGRAYPPALVEALRHPAYAAPRLEDRYVDLLALAVAAETGASVLVAQAPRAMIDLNRAIDDVDWEMISGGAGPLVATPELVVGAMRRARGGLGLVPRRLPGLGELWKRRFGRDEIAARITDVHAPYHAALADRLARTRDRWGAALLVDLHSMPPLQPRSPSEPPPEFVVGDRFGAACDGGLVASVFAHFALAGRLASHNRPYAGGYVLERQAHRARGIHAMQLEICRSAYLDSRLAEPGDGFAGMVTLLAGLVRALAVDVAELGRGRGHQWRAAAE